ncbi:DUF488 domain-containing protein [Streptomyces lunaelactis]|uniref:DUF488 domain-containing protein n=1 Tax=Streptomyces lunaelactis TaxID=1535768 RepID=A0A2R4SX88_9ACTN|nr:DUF488 family protein [Streptomyces lunaelactis]AVZ71491.1 DUF488 domain-containing protein [Streptomyces lunaelactis]NUK00881.1 DUF488 family protein [Streptomyces lunaelactis]NUK07413.1 DUF488 family protein [Streptomyces lunaelactis]NUK14762.1 DUF488 family protein [Streptomyces lunaelactis]NUK22143.1 DUF488 family protein [Streptomyces lunaelactis]
MVSGPFQVRRVYDPAHPDDGSRVLVDRLWPRGVSKERASVDAWLKDIAPSDELRHWYHEDRSRLEEFTQRYLRELADSDHAPAVDRLLALSAAGSVTVVTAVKDVERSHVPVLLTHLERRSEG